MYGLVDTLRHEETLDTENTSAPAYRVGLITEDGGVSYFEYVTKEKALDLIDAMVDMGLSCTLTRISSDDNVSLITALG